MPIAASYFVGFVGEEPVCHLAVAPKFDIKGYRATRLVVMPEWQGAGVGTKFLEAVCEAHKNGLGAGGRRYPTYFHTSHPQLCAYLKKSKSWALISQQMGGGDRVKSARSIKKSGNGARSGFGGHFRAVQGFKFLGL